MDQERFEAYVASMKYGLTQNSTRFYLRMLALIALGYTYIFTWLFLLFSLPGLLAFAIISAATSYACEFSVYPVITAAMVLGVCWYRSPKPDGIRLTRETAPELFEIIADFRKRLSGPPVHELYLLPSFDATLLPRPRLGPLGVTRNTIGLGLPMMQALSRQELRVILAHEYALLHITHSGLHGLTRRALHNFSLLVMRFARKEKNWYFLFNKRFNSYGPMRDALSVVLARTEELEADRISLDLAGGKHFAHALVGATAKNILLSEVIMPDLFARVAEDANPPAFFTEISESLRAGIGFEHGEELLSGLRAEVTASTSPSFAAIDRLAAVGAALALPPPVEVTAAEHFLGPHLPALVAQMDRTWQEASLDSWRSRHAYVVASTARLEALAALARERALSIDEAWERARITIEFQEPAEAIDRLQDTLEIDPHHPLANFTLGRILLERGDDTGIRHIDHAMDIDPLAEAPGCEIILEFLRHYERFDETEPYEERLDATRERGELAAAERKTISLHDHYAAHDLAPAAVEGLRDQLSGFPQVTEAYLVKKDVNHSPHQRLYVLGIVRGRWYHIQSRLGDVKLRRKLHKSLRIPDQFFVVILNDDNVHFMRKLRHIPNSRIL